MIVRDDAATIDSVAGFQKFRFVSRFLTAWRAGDVPVLCDISVRLRFGILVGLVLVGAVIFALTYAVAEGRINTMMIRQDGFRRLNDMAGDVRALSATLQNQEEQYLRDRDAALSDQFIKTLTVLAATLKDMEAQPQAQDMSVEIATLKTGYPLIGQRFETVVRLSEALGLRESSGLRGQLAASGKSLEDELKMWPNAGALMPSMLQMRLAEKNFLLYGGTTYQGHHRRYVNQFDFDLDQSPLPVSTREDLHKLVVTYGEDMQRFAETSVELAQEVSALRGQLQALRPTLDRVFAAARDGMLQASADQERVRRETSILVIAFEIMAMAVFFLVALVLARSITHPIRLIESSMDALAQGDHGVVVPGINRRDEIGDMAKAVAVFKDNAITMVRMQQEQEAIRAEAEAINRRRLLALASHFENEVKSVADRVSQNSQAIKATAETMIRHEDAQGDSRSLSVAEAAEESRQAVAAVAEAAQELSASVVEISSHAEASSDMVRVAVESLERTNAQVQGLSAVAGDIDRVTGLIGDIAARTNMLSLNATIEAQRAGAAGQGFAVVADEVKRLAQQTAASAREIAGQVSGIQRATAETVAAIGDVGTVIRRLDTISAQVASAVRRQASVTEKISRCVEDVTEDSRSVTDGVVAVTQSAARYCGSAVQVMWAAEDLAGPAGTLQGEVDEFLRIIRVGE